MAIDTLNHCVAKTQSTLNDLSESIAKAVALIQITLGIDFLDYPKRIQYDYLWALSDLLNHAQQLCDELAQ